MTTVVITAGGDGAALARLLRRLVPTGLTSDLSVIVVTYGNAGGAMEIAAGFGGDVVAMAIPAMSKLLALRAADAAASGFPRVFLDADIEIDERGVRALAAQAAEPGVLAAAPERLLDLAGCPPLVRWYYQVWARLPEVRRGLFGRGALAVSEAGHRRLSGLPALLAGDLGASLPFAPAERRIATAARVTVRPPASLAALLRSRAAMTAAARAWRAGQVPTAVARVRAADVIGVVGAYPAMLLRLPAFLAVTAAAWLLAMVRDPGDLPVTGSASAGQGRAG